MENKEKILGEIEENEELILAIEIGKKVKTIIAEKKISQEQLAAILGIHGTKLSRQLNGQQKINIRELKMLSQALSTTVGHLLGENEGKIELVKSEDTAFKAYELLKTFGPKIQKHYYAVFYYIDLHKKSQDVSFSMEE